LLADYRAWLLSELKLLGNASHHAYSFGQANMAGRAIEALDAETAKNVYIALDKSTAELVKTELEAAQSMASLPPGLTYLRQALALAVGTSSAAPGH
jgi:hypothetical protein